MKGVGEMIKTREKVGIITLDGYFNYGNRLQNYALQEVVKDLGFEVDTLIVPRKSLHPNYQKEKIITKLITKLTKRSPKETIKRFLIKITEQNHKTMILKRQEKFRSFSREFLSEKYCGSSEEELREIGKEYDFLIVGSDQVWNPYNITYAESSFFLTFVEPEKRISYAASFGITELPDYFKVMIKPWLAEMKAISVRESVGAQIVKELSGREAIITLDPTLLLSKQRWFSLAKESKKPKRYILTYFLGDLPKEATQLIMRMTRNSELKVVHLANLRDKQAYKTGPQEFIDYINSAEAILTDSFHGTAFSILFEVPFVVYERKGNISMYSRIKTLLNMLKLGNREAHNINSSEEVFNMSFDTAVTLLNKEREKAFVYLKNALCKF